MRFITTKSCPSSSNSRVVVDMVTGAKAEYVKGNAMSYAAALETVTTAQATAFESLFGGTLKEGGTPDQADKLSLLELQNMYAANQN